MNYIFYSWQSDAPEKDNRYFILKALKKLTHTVKEEFPVEIVQATGREIGTTDIPSSIFRNIECCDFFICDLTCLFSSDRKKAPNPNVMLELGYASSVLGWDRIICLFNKDYSDYDDLPFDLRNRRIIAYSTIDGKKLADELKYIYINLQKRIGQPVNLVIKHSSNQTLVQKFLLSDIIDQVSSDDFKKYSSDCLHDVLRYVLFCSVERVYPDDEDVYDWFFNTFGSPYDNPNFEFKIDTCISDYTVARSRRFLEVLWRNNTDHIDSCLITLKIRKDPKIVLLNDYEGEGLLFETSSYYIVRAKVNNIFPGESVKIIKLYLIYQEALELSITAKFILPNGFRKVLILREPVFVHSQPVCKDDFFSYWSN